MDRLTDGKDHAIIRHVKRRAYPLTQCLLIHMESACFQFCMQPMYKYNLSAELNTYMDLKKSRASFRGAFSMCCPPICSEPCHCVQLYEWYLFLKLACGISRTKTNTPQDFHKSSIIFYTLRLYARRVCIHSLVYLAISILVTIFVIY